MPRDPLNKMASPAERNVSRIRRPLRDFQKSASRGHSGRAASQPKRAAPIMPIRTSIWRVAAYSPSWRCRRSDICPSSRISPKTAIRRLRGFGAQNIEHVPSGLGIRVIRIIENGNAVPQTYVSPRILPGSSVATASISSWVRCRKTGHGDAGQNVRKACRPARQRIESDALRQ